MSRGSLHALLGVLLTGACALPAFEIDPSLGASGSGGAGGSAGAAGNGGLGGQSGSSAGTGSGKGGAAGNGNAGTSGELDREGACIEYCNTYIQACNGHVSNTYRDALDCVGVCGISDWPFGEDLDEVNSLQCRLTHAGFALAQRDPHCTHSGEFPMGAACAQP